MLVRFLLIVVVSGLMIGCGDQQRVGKSEKYSQYEGAESFSSPNVDDENNRPNVNQVGVGQENEFPVFQPEHAFVPQPAPQPAWQPQPEPQPAWAPPADEKPDTFQATCEPYPATHPTCGGAGCGGGSWEYKCPSTWKCNGWADCDRFFNMWGCLSPYKTEVYGPYTAGCVKYQ